MKATELRAASPVLFPSTERGVPHISLVFREMWETTALHVLLLKVGKKVKVRGLPHLAKNERDMGHPTLCGREKDRMGSSSAFLQFDHLTGCQDGVGYGGGFAGWAHVVNPYQMGAG
jgi:hypothetical protein